MLKNWFIVISRIIIWIILYSLFFTMGIFFINISNTFMAILGGIIISIAVIFPLAIIATFINSLPDDGRYCNYDKKSDKRAEFYKNMMLITEDMYKKMKEGENNA